MALSNARSQIKNFFKIRRVNFLAIRSRFASSLFATPLLYLTGLIVLSCLLGIATPALAQTAPYLNANGWTVFTPVTGTGSCGNSSSNYTGTCVVFVVQPPATIQPVLLNSQASPAPQRGRHARPSLMASARFVREPRPTGCCSTRAMTFHRQSSGFFLALRSAWHIGNDAAFDLSLWLRCPPARGANFERDGLGHRQLWGRRMRRRRQQHRDRRHRVLCLHARS